MNLEMFEKYPLFGATTVPHDTLGFNVIVGTGCRNSPTVDRGQVLSEKQHFTIRISFWLFFFQQFVYSAISLTCNGRVNSYI